MSAFEYVSVLASIIIGLALVDILVSTNRLIRAGSAVKWDWAAPAAAILVVMTLLQMWWGQYRPSGDNGMTIGQFLPLFVELVILFLLAAAALPDEVPAEGLDLRAYYQKNSRYFWGLFLAALGWIILIEAIGRATSGGDALGFLAARTIDLSVLLVFASLMVVKQRWWHLLALVFFSIGPIGWLSRSLGSA